MAERPLRLALVGATGAVGRATLEVLEDLDVPVASLRPLASGRSAGGAVPFQGEDLRVEEVRQGSFRGSDLALLAAPAAAARTWAPVARAEGCLVVDASSAFRGDAGVPLLVPQVNPEEAGRLPKGIAASACGLVPALALALRPIRDAAGLARAGVVALESASGAGRGGIAQLESESLALMTGREPDPPATIPYRLAFNLVPDASRAGEAPGGGVEAEALLAADLARVLGGELAVSAIAVRVPVFYGHAAVVSLTTRKPLPAEEARALLRGAAGVKVIDDPAERLYPMPMLSVNDDAVLAGRVREDPTRENGLELFLAVDNLRRGGATNLVEVARLIAGRHLGAG
jgi:aspartate-semialdehyde dehydrogenase